MVRGVVIEARIVLLKSRGSDSRRRRVGYEGRPLRVFLDGQWIEVPDDAIVVERNKYGRPVVWPYYVYVGDEKGGSWEVTKVTRIRCFMPGTEA